MTSAKPLGFLVFVALALVLASCQEPLTPSGDPPPFPDAKPGPEWVEVEARGFSMLLPPDWTFNELQGVDSYVGEVTGDGMVLMFDYGRHSWGLNPEDEPEHTYHTSYENIGGNTAKLLLATDPPGATTAPYPAATGVYISSLRGQTFNLIGRGLTREQQRIAVAIFRGIR